MKDVGNNNGGCRGCQRGPGMTGVDVKDDSEGTGMTGGCWEGQGDAGDASGVPGMTGAEAGGTGREAGSRMDFCKSSSVIPGSLLLSFPEGPSLSFPEVPFCHSRKFSAGIHLSGIHRTGSPGGREG